MNRLLLCILISFQLSVFCIKRKYIHPVDDEQYPILVKLADGSFSRPVSEQSTKEKSAIVKCYF